jgi:hypothetical protein
LKRVFTLNGKKPPVRGDRRGYLKGFNQPVTLFLISLIQGFHVGVKVIKGFLESGAVSGFVSLIEGSQNLEHLLHIPLNPTHEVKDKL